MSRHKVVLAASVLLAALTWFCGSDPEEQKRRLLDLGTIQYEAGNHRLADLLFRKAIQLDRLYGEAYYRLGLNHIAQQEFRPAAAALWRAYECPNSGDEAFRLLAEIYLRIYTASSQRDPRLVSELEYLLGLERSRNPESSDVPMVEGAIALHERQYADAIARFKKVLAIRSNDASATVYLCRALDGDGKAEEASERARRFLHSSPDNLSLYDFLHSQLARARRWEDAGALRREAVAANPKSLEARVALAAHYYRVSQAGSMNGVLRQILDENDLFPDGYLTVAEFHMRLGRTSEAVKVYEEGLQRAGADSDRYRLGLALALLAVGDRARARSILDPLLEKDPTNVAALSLRASIHLGDPARPEEGPAIRDLVSALRLKPGDPFLRFALGDAYLRHGDAFAAQAQFSEALEREPGFLLPKLALASLALSNHEFEKAQVLAEEVLSDHPQHLGAQLLLADSWIGLREFDEARALLNSILTEHPDYLEALHAMARLQALAQRFDDAMKTYRAILRRAPGDPRAIEGTVGVLVAAGRLSQARELLEGELGRSPENTGARMALAAVESHLGMTESALANYGLVAERHPGRADVHTRMAEACIQLNRLEDAREHLSVAIHLDSNASDAKTLLGVLEMAAGKRRPAIRLFEEALEHEPDSVVALNNLAYLLMEENRDLDRALTLAQRARSLAPHDDAVADTIAWVLLKRNLASEAAPLFRTLVDRFPQRARYRCGLAQALVETGSHQEARIQLSAARNLNPNPQEAAMIESLASRLGG